MDADVLKRIRARRRAAGHKQEDFARLAGIPERTYSDYERGITPIPMERMRAIAKTLNCGVWDLDPTIAPSKPKPPPDMPDRTVELVELAIDKAINRVMGANDMEVARLKRENAKLQSKVDSVPAAFWPVWQDKAKSRVRAVFLFLLLGGKEYEDQVPEPLRKILTGLRRDLDPR